MFRVGKWNESHAVFFACYRRRAWRRGPARPLKSVVSLNLRNVGLVPSDTWMACVVGPIPVESHRSLVWPWDSGPYYQARISDVELGPLCGLGYHVEMNEPFPLDCLTVAKIKRATWREEQDKKLLEWINTPTYQSEGYAGYQTVSHHRIIWMPSPWPNKYSQLSAYGHSRKRTALLTDAFSIPRFTSQSNSVFTHSRKRTLSLNRTRTLLKIKIGFFFCLRTLVSGHPKYNNKRSSVDNNWLLAMEFVFNLQ